MSKGGGGGMEQRGVMVEGGERNFAVHTLQPIIGCEEKWKGQSQKSLKFQLRMWFLIEIGMLWKELSSSHSDVSLLKQLGMRSLQVNIWSSSKYLPFHALQKTEKHLCLTFLTLIFSPLPPTFPVISLGFFLAICSPSPGDLCLFGSSCGLSGSPPELQLDKFSHPHSVVHPHTSHQLY